jgi:DNA-directed RNA polymerase subunit RPC12/RpoP
VRTLDETPDLRWFKTESYACRMCGKRAAGELMSYRNETYGMHCQKCADKRLAASKRVREQLAAEGEQ